ncbi:MAG TPA: rhodanese-like domain-containing protein, partial [Bacteroidota bacterium]
MKALLVFLFSLVVSPSIFAQGRTVPFFVSTQWLADNMKDPDIVVLHVSFGRREYDAGHIPGARFLWYNWLAESTPDLSTEMPAAEKVDTVLENFGITDRSKIVLYFTGQNITTTTRMLLAFSYFGFGDAISVLDGGFDAWKSENRTVSTETPVVRKTLLTLKTNPSVISDADWVKNNLTAPNVAIVDARTKNFYDGNGGGILRQGHIKGAKSIPYTAMLDSTARLKDIATLKKIFEDAGITPGTKVVTYCHVGQQATLVYAVAKMLGYDAAVYDGCFEDWNVRGEEYPVVNPS